MNLRQKVMIYINRNGVSQAEFCRRAKLKSMSRFSRHFKIGVFTNKDDLERIGRFFESKEESA